MPIFEYSCDKCNKQFEEISIHKDSVRAECPECGNLCPKTVPSKMTFYLKGWCWSGDGYSGKNPEREASLKHKKTWDKHKEKIGI